MDHYVILAPVDLKIILGPVWSDFGWGIDHDVPIGKLPFQLSGVVLAAIHDPPVLWRLNTQLHRIRFVIDHIHEDIPAVEVRMASIELRKSAGQIVAEHLVAE